MHMQNLQKNLKNKNKIYNKKMPFDADTQRMEQNSACQFATLATYNNLTNPANMGVPVIPPTTAVGWQAVPAYSRGGYDTLMRSGTFPCGGHPSITNAYGSNANNCQTQYVKRMCA